MKTVQIKDIKSVIIDKKLQNEQITVKCWIRTNRDSGKIGFIEGYDGSTLDGIQIVYKKEVTKNFEEAKTTRIASAIKVIGKVSINEKVPAGYEIIADEFVLLKQADEDYPLQKKQHTMEFLRENAHLRIRTYTMQAIMKVRSKLAYSIHKFFQENGFMWVASPILTSNDCEGAGESFLIEENKDAPFFVPQAKLTVSGQLNAESYAQGFGRVYTFGPTFRADRSHTNRHLAEFWMVEPEIAFIDLEQLMSIIEAFIKTVVQDMLTECRDAIDFFAKNNPDILNRLTKLVEKKFIRVSYEEGIDILKRAVADGHNFEDKNIYFGKDLASEHERYICEKIYNAPVFLYNYPKDIKAFYMKLNKDNRTVAAVDLLVPGIGEIVGGSQREDDMEKLQEQVKVKNINPKSIQWYLDLRKYGYDSSAGFGLGFERLLMYILGLENIRDAIPFPRYEGKLTF